MHIFSVISVVNKVNRKFDIFRQLKNVKHILNLCCRQAAETGSLFVLIVDQETKRITNPFGYKQIKLHEIDIAGELERGS
jgi:hypothetical protein